MPVKLFRLLRVRLSTVVPEPAIRVTEALLGERLKSTKWKAIVDVVWDRVPFVPVTVTE